MNTGINQEVIIGRDMNGHVGQVANGFHEAHGEDMREKGLCREDAWDRSRWRKML